MYSQQFIVPSDNLKLIATPVSSFTPDSMHPVAVDLKPYGDIFILRSKTSETYVGILSDSKIVKTLTRFSLRLDATLLISEDEQVKQPAKSKSSKHMPIKSARKYSLRIVIHGLRRDKQTIGDLFAEADLFLQHPSVDEPLPNVEYDNPHYLLRPGAQMAKLKDMCPEGERECSVEHRPGDDISRSHLVRLFDAAAASDGAVTVPNTTSSPRLRSALMT